MDKLTKLYVDEVVRLHGVKVSIISDKTLVYFKIAAKVTIGDGNKSTLQYNVSSSKWWSIQKNNIDIRGFTEGLCIRFWGNWEDQVPLIKFTNNYSYQATISMASYESLYGRNCYTLVC